MDHYWGEAYTLETGDLILSAFDNLVGIGLRIVVNNAMSFLTLNASDRYALRKLIKSAVKSARYSARLVREPAMLSKEKPYKKKYYVPQKIRLDEISPASTTDVLKDIDTALMNSGLDVSARALNTTHEVTRRYFTDSGGCKIEFEKPLINFDYLITVGKGEDTLQRFSQSSGSAGGELYRKWNLRKRALDDSKILSEILKKGVSPPRGVIDVVIAPEVTGIAVHESGGHPYEADRIFGREAAQAGESFVTPEMIGKKMGNEIVSVVDDPTLAHSAGFYLFDDEGVKARRKYLIKNGVINELLHNRETARAMNIQSNGSARVEDFSYEPIVRMSNTFMLPGKHSEQELIRGVKNGVYIKSFMEWNIDDLRLNQKYVGNEAYLIRNGRLGKLVKSPVLEISTPDFYSSIDALSRKVEFSAGTCGKGEPIQGVPVWMGGPAARLRRIKLGR
jgi:TldD protein